LTKQRSELGQCFVATRNENIVGKLMVYAPDRQSDLRWYWHPGVASIHQFALHPEHQRAGVGDALVRTAETCARAHRNSEPALDTPEHAQRLRKYYRKHHCRRVGSVQLEGKSYRKWRSQHLRSINNIRTRPRQFARFVLVKIA
jgi:ribosomal protein S18 acetylase RimI-like enzyme